MQFQFDIGLNRVMVYEPYKGLIHYVNREVGLIASMGPLQPEEQEPEEGLAELFEQAQLLQEMPSDEDYEEDEQEDTD